jgi:hypothetical protein
VGAIGTEKAKRNSAAINGGREREREIEIETRRTCGHGEDGYPVCLKLFSDDCLLIAGEEAGD